jgi:hypothetical protein
MVDPNIQILQIITSNIRNMDALRVVIANVFDVSGRSGARHICAQAACRVSRLVIAGPTMGRISRPKVTAPGHHRTAEDGIHLATSEPRSAQTFEQWGLHTSFMVPAFGL